MSVSNLSAADLVVRRSNSFLHFMQSNAMKKDFNKTINGRQVLRFLRSLELVHAALQVCIAISRQRWFLEWRLDAAL